MLFLGLVNLIGEKALAADYKILALGDSLTAGYRLNQGDGFAEQLEKRLQEIKPGLRVINGGVSGDTSQSGLARLGWALADQPDMVIVELGANDALRGLDPELTRKNIEQIILQLKEKNIKILLAGMLAPPNLGDAYGQKFNVIYPDLAKQHGVALYPFFLEGVAGHPDLNLDDGIHPTKEGIAIITDQILPYVLKVID
ncbi:arylesterase [Terasakiella sp. A23]|uniref:arylesterase n=1 Tax=Terasakiella sp. FCG-A23 TaxID=3080561 RepID=UPI002954EB85|nr:arylesterase [Terasakiella sp. A23]MDV7340539.1 arylesterase [Terasakiella sp. A23]